MEQCEAGAVFVSVKMGKSRGKYVGFECLGVNDVFTYWAFFFVFGYAYPFA